ncbi:MAG TPA: SagB/ThcOx family dehydrogenase [Gaiellaceae bacterium]|nr:SagB/ThcOx family dehydrogenase [Gaiellaceae bacterium]
MTRQVPTAEFASLVYGRAGVPLDDSAEAFHEASRLYPNIAPRRLAALRALATSPELQQTVLRSGRTHTQRPQIDLPERELPRSSLWDLLRTRRSKLESPGRSLGLGALSALLHASYAASPREPEGTRRPVPSGGALYPLELYVLALEVEGLERCVSHYNPFRHSLEVLASVERADVGRSLVDPALADRAAALIVVTAMFWRSRFKYGPRGYRFALLEAGHLMQNAVLAATSLEIDALPLGGFYDRRLDSLIGADGLDEASVYALLLGGRG